MCLFLTCKLTSQYNASPNDLLIPVTKVSFALSRIPNAVIFLTGFELGFEFIPYIRTQQQNCPHPRSQQNL